MKLLDLVLGKCSFSLPKKQAAKLADLCMKLEIEYSPPVFEGATVYSSCHLLAFRRLKAVCEKNRLELTLESCTGLPFLLEKQRSRIGLLVGALLSALLILIALNTVWRIDLTGNKNISRREIELLLAENDFEVGSFIPRIDLTLVENGVMQSNADVAWISINMNGTVAKVEIRESGRVGEIEAVPADLVATRDGKIERIEAYDGETAVKVGDVVRAGQLLVSGACYSDEGEITRLSRAKGSIMARTVREISVEIPFENTQKAYTGRKFYEIYINFFKKSIKVFANTGKMPPSCDIIYKNGELGLFDLPKMPIGFECREFSEYAIRAVTLSEEEAMTLAFDMLEDELESLSKDIELLRKETEFEISDSAYVLKCRLTCVENIAVVREIK